VSVVIAAFNAERWIRETIKSVLSQTYKDFELIVVDDGSNDATGRIVQEFGDKIRYFYQINLGQPAARNVGIRAARGQYIAFIDADDLWLPSKLDCQLKLIDQTGSAWAYCDAHIFDMETQTVRWTTSQIYTLVEGDVLRPLLLNSFIASPTPLIRRDVFKTVGYFDESVDRRIGEDWNMWLRIASRYPVVCLREPLAIVRSHSASMIRKMDLDNALSSRLLIINDAVERNPGRLQDLKRQALSRAYVESGKYALARGRHAEARQMFVQAIKHSPVRFPAWFCYVVSFLPRPLINRFRKLRRRINRQGKIRLTV